MKYEERLLLVNSELSQAIVSLRRKLNEVCAQRDYPLQDDWDDAINSARISIECAEDHVAQALRDLQEGV